MKRIFTFILSAMLCFAMQAQTDSTSVKVQKKNVVTVIDDSKGTQVTVGDNPVVEVITTGKGDTTTIRIGNRKFDVIDNSDGTKVYSSRQPQEKKKQYSRFNGHWGGFELGANYFHTADYSLYEGAGFGDFFDLNYGKSLTFNFNFAEYAFSNPRNTFALVTGMGLSFMDFRFDQPVTIVKQSGNGLIVPVQLDEPTLKKSKLNISYLTAPLILELATPLRLKSHRLTIGAGVIGGLNIGSRTKVKTDSAKSKERRNFNINPLKYELTGRLGLGEVCLFANYGMTPLFKDGKGPELVPFTVGISFPNARF